MATQWEGSWETVSRTHKSNDGNTTKKENGTTNNMHRHAQKTATTTPSVSQVTNSEPSKIMDGSLRSSSTSVTSMVEPLDTTGIAEKEALAKLPVLLNNYILSKCESNEHCRKTDFDGTAREALLRISFLQALQAVENFAGSVSSRIQKRSAYLMCILHGKEQHWEKSRAAAGLKGGASTLLALLPTVQVTLAELCLRGNCLPSDFTPEICLSLHRLSPPLIIKAMHAFNSNKRIGAGKCGGVLNRPRFFQRLIQNVAEQSIAENAKLENSTNKNGKASKSASSTPTSQSSTTGSTSSFSDSSTTESNSVRKPGSFNGISGSGVGNSAKFGKNRLVAQSTLSGKEIPLSSFEDTEIENGQRAWECSSSLLQRQGDSGSVDEINEQAIEKETLHSSNSQKDIKPYGEGTQITDSSFMVGDMNSGDFQDNDTTDYFQQYQEQLLLQQPHLNSWHTDGDEQLGCAIEGEFSQLSVDVNGQSSSRCGFDSNWQQQENTRFSPPSIMNDLICTEPALQMHQQHVSPHHHSMDSAGDIGMQQRSQSHALLQRPVSDGNWVSSGGGFSDGLFLSSTATVSTNGLPQQHINLPNASKTNENMLVKEIRMLNSKLDAQESNGRVLGEEVARLRSTCQQLHEENMRIVNEHQALLAGLRQMLNHQQRNELGNGVQ